MEGYRIVSIDENDKVTTLTTQSADNLQKVNIIIGTIEEPLKTGLYLGTTKDFVKTYYTDLTDNEDLLLVYEFDEKDIKKGNLTDRPSEIIVSKAKLKAVFRLINEEEIEFKAKIKNIKNKIN